MPTTYTWTDNEDGTGATVAISGGAGLDSHSVYSQRFTGGLGSDGVWTLSGSRLGNGSVSLNLDPGHFFGYVVSSSGGVDSISSVEYFATTSGSDSIHFLLLQAIQARIIAVNLADVGSNVLIRKIPTERGHDSETYPYPAVIVSPLGTEQLPGGTNVRDDIGYPVLVSILAKNNQDLSETNLNKFLLWRELIAKAFRGDQQLVTGGDWNAHRTKVEPGPVISPSAVWNNLFQCSLTIRCEARQTRGL